MLTELKAIRIARRRRVRFGRLVLVISLTVGVTALVIANASPSSPRSSLW